MFVHSRFSYTTETIIHGGQAGLTIQNVKVRTNPKTRDSRLFKSTLDYLRRSLPVIFRSYGMYWPVQTIGYLAAPLFIVGFATALWFLYSSFAGHVSLLVLGGIYTILLALLVGRGDRDNRQQ